MRRHGPVNVIFYYPKTEAGKQELAKRVAEVHADTVTRRIKKLNCPTSQKLELLDSVLTTVRQRSLETESSEHNGSHISKKADRMNLCF